MKTDVAWAAGLFEGEGCFSQRSKVPPIYPIATLSIVDKDVFDRFVAIVKVGVQRVDLLPSGKEMWTWTANGHDAVTRVFNMFSPYLGSRRLERGNDVLGNPQSALAELHSARSLSAK